MTEKLYERDAYLRRFTARVLSCAQGKRGWEVTLERTAFYPEGGGQPGDTGTLGGARVLDTRERGGEVVHLCDSPLTPGEEVAGEIDWARRFDHMQQHSGEHIVSGLICARLGCDNVGFHLGAETVTIDFNKSADRDTLREIEREANRCIWENRPFEVAYPTPEELARIPYRSKKELTGNVRIVTCPGADCCACCGTHVQRAGEIGLIKLLSVKPFREGVRIEMAAGVRAYDYISAIVEQNSRISALLSAKVGETAEAVRRQGEELAAVKYRLVGLENRLFAEKAAAFAGAGDVLLIEAGLDADGLRRLCAAVTAVSAGVCAVFSGEAGRYRYAVGRPGGDVRALVKDLNAALHGRGGGKPDFAQGSVEAAEADIRAFFEGRRE